ncbi:MAG: hypothetical protein JXA99_08165 [Candidatus Lokiarchaeota archaeon]|nr:hypothetical protein [Candidatus Lokiarchaeota archaeon]
MIIINNSFYLSQKSLKYMTIIGFLIFLVVTPIMMYFYEISNYPVNFFESQLSFDGNIIKAHYTLMNRNEINLYKLANIFDYFFLISMGVIRFSVCIRIKRRFDNNSMLKKIGNLFIILGILSTIFDGLENIFILLMANDPIAFPNWYALIHSWFAFLKYILMFGVMVWIPIGLIFSSIYFKNK